MKTEALRSSAQRFGVDPDRLLGLLAEIIPAYEVAQLESLTWNRKNRANGELASLLSTLERANAQWNALSSEVVDDLEEHARRTRYSDLEFGKRLFSLVHDLLDYRDIFRRERSGNPGTSRTSHASIDTVVLKGFVTDLMSIWPERSFGAAYHFDKKANYSEPISQFLRFASEVCNNCLASKPSLQSLARAIEQAKAERRGSAKNNFDQARR